MSPWGPLPGSARPDPGELRSDGCSSPLGRWMEATWPLAGRCCRDHDVAYGLGGGARERLIADLTLFRCLLLLGLPILVAQQAYNAVRLFGGPHFRWREGAGPDLDVPVVAAGAAIEAP